MENLAQNPMFFFPMAGLLMCMALGVLFSTHAIKALLYLVLCMLGIGVVFISLGAVFLGGVQFAVYAGAVMVLFLITLMLSGPNSHELHEESWVEKASVKNFVKMGSVGVLLGVCIGAFSLRTYSNKFKFEEGMSVTKKISINLFTEHVFLFETIGVLLLVIAVAVVAVSRIGESKK